MHTLQPGARGLQGPRTHETGPMESLLLLDPNALDPFPLVAGGSMVGPHCRVSSSSSGLILLESPIAADGLSEKGQAAATSTEKLLVPGWMRSAAARLVSYRRRTPVQLHGVFSVGRGGERDWGEWGAASGLSIDANGKNMSLEWGSERGLRCSVREVTAGSPTLLAPFKGAPWQALDWEALELRLREIAL